MPAAIDWTPELESAFIEGIIAGKSIDSISKDNGITAISFYRRRANDENFDATIVRAQEAAQEREMDNLVDLADQANEDNANAIKLRVWTRMWIAGKRKPKKYGDKIQQEHSGEVGIRSLVVQPDPKAKAARPEVKPRFSE